MLVNVLISDEGFPMLTDFGSATLKECGLQFTSAASAAPFSPRWAAPEILDGNKCNNAGDVYAMAMEILTGKVPYHDMNDPAVIRSVMINKKIPERPESQIPTRNTHSDRLWGLLVDCWSFAPEKRPTAAMATKIVST
ncbi:Ankyrin repeat and protein kinase domain-containing protein 1 [Ceratobasidium sp. 392]|nr:Ankyrin repeat and protein kinase domain-containing protein 1 [Ceratobasidium sp. 392]